jgi:type IV pilus assembly protein PilB
MNQSRSKNSRVKVGELLLAQGLIDEDQLEHALSEHKRTGILLGKILVRLGMVDEKTLSSVLGQQIQLKTKKRLGEILMDRGYINEEQLNLALDEQKKSGIKLGEALIKLSYITEDRLIEILSAQLEIPTVKLDTFQLDMSVTNLLSEDMCRNYKVMPLYIREKVLTIAMCDPSNLRTLDHVKFKTQMEVEAVMASERDLIAALDKIYGTTGETLVSLLSNEVEEIETVDDGDREEEEELSDEEGRQVVKIVSTLINEAIAKGASDIHLEPQETHLQIRYRVDGELAVMPPIPGRLMGQIISRLKIMSKMDIAEKRKPLDGRFTVKFKRKEVDMRVSSFPTILRKRGVAEKIVMRILDPDGGQIAIKDMGIHPSAEQAFRDAIALPNGIVLVTGPTGSGKSTTLYAAIREILSPTINITTMEDPVELNLDGVSQGQINKAAGFTFAAGIRAILRQDPDVIMIGEMRDQETAGMAIESALTGHLVFSTLHTNNAPGAIPRLLEMGLEPFLVASAIKGILAQRLVRRICKKCKQPFEITKELRESLGLSKDATFFKGVGCKDCEGSGYRGRAGIYEFLVPNESIRNIILRHGTAEEIKREAMMNTGFITLRMDGIDKAMKGITTLEAALAASDSDTDQ